jgi:transcriptional antiterminator RfaH
MLSRTSAAHQDVISYRSGPAWHVVYTEPQAEKEAQVGIRDLGLDVYMPMERWARRVRGKSTVVSKPLIPRYVFVAFDPGLYNWGPILSVDGVLELLRNEGLPMRVPQAQIERLWGAEAVGAFDRTRSWLEVGEAVRVKDGPFAGHIGLIESFVAKLRSCKAKRRVKLVMGLLGRVELDLCEVEKV